MEFLFLGDGGQLRADIIRWVPGENQGFVQEDAAVPSYLKKQFVRYRPYGLDMGSLP